MIVLGQLPHCSELVLDITLKLRKQAFAAARPAPLQSLLDCAGMSDRHLTRIGRLTALCLLVAAVVTIGLAISGALKEARSPVPQLASHK